MGFFHEKKNVEKYIQMAEGYDGKEIIADLRQYLPKNSSLLEIGMGPGSDYQLLQQNYHVTGSDYSALFVNRFKRLHPEADVLVLDAITLDTNQKYQGLYSNKVLIHLTREQLKQSIQRQIEILHPEGIICHSFWHGDKEEHFDGLLFTCYTKEQLKTLFQKDFHILKMEKYQEMEPNDSIFLIAKRKE